MNPPKIEVFVATSSLYSGELTKPIEFGRESESDAGRLYSLLPHEGAHRMAIAGKEYPGMSRQLLRISPLPDGHIRVQNLSDKDYSSIQVRDRQPLGPKQQRDYDLPVSLTIFDRRIQISPADTEVVMSMNEPVLPPGSSREKFSVDVSSHFPLVEKLDAPQRDQLTKWLGAVTRVLQSAVGAADFAERAAEEMVKLIGLDSGRVLDIAPDGTWSVIASYERQSGRLARSEWVPVSGLLRQVTSEKKTCWTMPGSSQSNTASMEGLWAAIAAPLLDRNGAVTGVLYGDRAATMPITGELIGTLEAMLVETLARGVAAGQSRVEQERAAAEVRVRFEQFFTPELSRQLAANPDLLTPRDTEVSILFCDIRRFSTISEERGAEVTMEWLRDVMGTLADIAADLGGALIDYLGDQLMIMWGAPIPQPDHAARACEAALKMAREVPKLDGKWRETLGHTTQLGFGVNTGTTRVGNVGFERKFRYAPFGNTVNLASRVEGATKYFGVNVIVTEDTFSKVSLKPVARRLCCVRVVNIDHPVALYELHAEDISTAEELCKQYEAALASYERSELTQAVHAFSDILRTHPKDGPTLLLLSRAVSGLHLPEGKFDPVINLDAK